MKTLQLTQSETEEIRKVLSQVRSVQQASVFGSRALGSARKGSDVDIVLFGDVSPSDNSLIRMKLNEETTLPYFFDVLTFQDIENKDLKAHIEQYGMEVYRSE